MPKLEALELCHNKVMLCCYVSVSVSNRNCYVGEQKNAPVSTVVEGKPERSVYIGFEFEPVKRIALSVLKQ